MIFDVSLNVKSFLSLYFVYQCVISLNMQSGYIVPKK